MLTPLCCLVLINRSYHHLICKAQHFYCETHAFSGIAHVDDVDIVGGNDSLVSSFPQVEIRKDATQKISKSNSSAGCSGSLSSGSCSCIFNK